MFPQFPTDVSLLFTYSSTNQLPLHIRGREEREQVALKIRKKKKKDLKIVAAAAAVGASIGATVATAISELHDILSFFFLLLLLPGIGRNFAQLISSPQGIMRTNRKQLVLVSWLLIINLHGCA